MAKINLIDKTEREGEISSIAYRVPTNIQNTIEFHALLDQIDLEDSTLNLKIDVDVSEDGVKWRYWGGVVYVGGKYDPPGIPGFGTLNTAMFKNKYVRVRVEPNKRIPIGAEVEDKETEIGSIRSI